MTIEELKEQLDFAVQAIQRKGTRVNIQGSVKVLVTLSNQTVALDLNEVGFDDKGGMLYLETKSK